MGGGEKKGKKKEMKCGVRGWWGKGEKKKEKKNNVMIKTKSKNQNLVPNTIFFYNLEFK